LSIYFVLVFVYGFVGGGCRVSSVPLNYSMTGHASANLYVTMPFS